MEAKAVQKQMVYNNEHAIREGNEPTTTSTVITSILPTTTNVPVTPKPASSPQPPAPAPVSLSNGPSTLLITPTTTADPIAELTKQFSQLALFIQSNMQSPKMTPASTSPASMSRISRCIWCDSTDHVKRQCPELPIALQKGLIRYNNENRIVSALTGQEILPMYGRGGMQVLLQA